MTTQTSIRPRLLLIAGVVVAAIGLVWALAPKPAGPTPAQERIAKAEAAVRYAARDPDAVQFRGVVDYEIAVCGEFNGKNGFGAYAGFNRFIWSGGSLSVDNGAPEFAELWGIVCKP